MGDKVGYAIVKEEHTIKKRILPQNTVFSVEQSAIIGAIQSGKNSRHEIVIITDSLSTVMAAESRTPTKNLKTQTIRKMLDQEEPRIILLWVLSHKGIPGNEKADQAAKEAPDEDIPTTERYPPDDLKKYLTEENFKKRNQRWKNGNKEMKERKLDVDRKEDTKGIPRKGQVAELRTGCTGATNGSKMEGVGNPLCPFCNTDIFTGSQRCYFINSHHVNIT
jgi:ribonuclease HI